MTNRFSNGSAFWYKTCHCGVNNTDGVSGFCGDCVQAGCNRVEPCKLVGSAETGGREGMTNEELISAAKDADWMQVVGNGGPPCFHYEDYRQRFCLRAQRWFGHADQPTDVDHKFVSLADLLEANLPRPSQNQTVSSGVEGAHEGTTADKSVALAESSLSSPPPDKCPSCGGKDKLNRRVSVSDDGWGTCDSNWHSVPRWRRGDQV